jgi:hypothetical protein
MFTVFSGSIAGTEHIRPGQPGYRNNQDALVTFVSDELIIGVVCDGCGSGDHSEFASQLQANALVAALRTHIPRLGLDQCDQAQAEQRVTRLLRQVQQHMVGQLSAVAHAMLSPGDNFQDLIQHHFLATVVGFVITKRWTFQFNCGDGAYGVNGAFNVLKPMVFNTPAYPGYLLTGSSALQQDPTLFDLKLLGLQPTDTVTSVWVGSDGVVDLNNATERFLPGKTRTVGPLAQLWDNPDFQRNTSSLQRLLNLANLDVPSTSTFPNPSRGLLPDDTTLVVAVRNPQPEEASNV